MVERDKFEGAGKKEKERKRESVCVYLCERERNNERSVNREKKKKIRASPQALGLGKIPVQVSAIETCFMSMDELLVARILSKSWSPYIRRELNMKKFF